MTENACSRQAAPPVINIELIRPKLQLAHAEVSEPLENAPVESLPPLTEMWSDIVHLVERIAKTYTDLSTPMLHTDEIVADCYRKLAELIDRDYFASHNITSRHDFFRMFKTVMNNHVKGLVQRNRFTIKRTGIKPPKKGAVLDSETSKSYKPVEISLDDPENTFQLEDSHVSTHSELDWNELKEDFFRGLTPVEKLVFEQNCAPNDVSLFYATVDAQRGSKQSSFVVSKANLARGIGLDVTSFDLVLEGLKKKHTVFKNMSDQIDGQHNPYNEAISALEKTFNVTVPQFVRQNEITTVRRLFTVLSRKFVELVTDEVKAHLKVVGAQVVEFNGNLVRCFGVLHDERDRCCTVCGVRRSCKSESENFGLDGITIDPELRSSKDIRVAVLVPQPEEAVTTEAVASEPSKATHTTNVSSTEITDDSLPEVPVTNVASGDTRSASIFNYLVENFRRVTDANGEFFCHREKFNQIFCIKKMEPFMLRFCRPSDGLAAKLNKVGSGYYLNDATSAEEAIRMIDVHSTEKYASK